jgi:dienelactone hydrolase
MSQPNRRPAVAAPPKPIRYTITITGREDLGSRTACLRAMGQRLEKQRQARALEWVGDPDQLAAKRREVLGQLLYNPAPVPLRPKLLCCQQTPSGERRVYRLQINPDDTTQAVLVLPHGASRTRRVPALLAMHEHGGMLALGKEKLFAGMTGKAFTAYHQHCYGGQLPGDYFASRGFAVLCIDQFGFGSRALWLPEDEPCRDLQRITPRVDLNLRLRMRYEQYFVHRALLAYGATESDVAIHDSRRALDFLQSIPEVDGSRIGAFGLSVGAMHTHHLAALDERIKAAVPVCWTGDYRTMIDRDGPRGLGTHFLPPSVSQDLHPAEWVALSAPRPVLILNGRQDALYPFAAQERARKTVARYARLQQPGRITWSYFDGPHCFVPAQQAQALAFFRQHLGPVAAQADKGR